MYDLEIKKIFIDRIYKIFYVSREDYKYFLTRCIDLYETEKYKKYLQRYKEHHNEIPINNLIWHVSTGGFAHIFRLNQDYCIRVHMNNPGLLEWTVPKDIEANIEKKEFLSFLNIPVACFKNYYLQGLYHYYTINALIVFLINNIIIKKKFILTREEVDSFYESLRDGTIVNTYVSVFKDSRTNERATDLFMAFIHYVFKVEKETYPIVMFNNFENYAKLTSNLLKKSSLDKVSTERIFSILTPKIIDELKHLEIIGDEEGVSNLNNIIHINITEINESAEIIKGNIVVQHFGLGNFYSLRISESGNITPDIDAIRAPFDKDYFKLFILQVILGMAGMNKSCGFIHNDLKPDNIIVFKNSVPFRIEFNKYIFVFKEKYVFRINDFDLSSTNNIKNPIKNEYNERLLFNDIHFFFVSIFRNKEYINRHSEVYKLFYNKLIKSKCQQCDKVYKSGGVHKFHQVESNIKVNIFNLITNDIFKKWIA